MVTPDGVTVEDWERVKEYALEIVNASDEVVAIARTKRLLSYLELLSDKYGALPSLMVTRADYIEDEQERELLYLSAYDVAASRADALNCVNVAHSLAEFYVPRFERRDEAGKWLAQLKAHLEEHHDEHIGAAYRRLLREFHGS